MTFDKMKLSITGEYCCAVTFMISVTFKPVTITVGRLNVAALRVVLLSVAAPSLMVLIQNFTLSICAKKN